MLNEHRIAAISVQLAPGFIRNNNIEQNYPGLQGEVAYGDELTPSHLITFPPRRRSGNRRAIRRGSQRSQGRQSGPSLLRIRPAAAAVSLAYRVRLIPGSIPVPDTHS